MTTNFIGRYTASAIASALRKSFLPPRLELATEMMRTDAGLHADQAREQIGKACFDLTTRPLLPQHDCATTIEPNDVSDSVLSQPWRAPCLGAPGQLIAGGAGARPDHPISGRFQPIDKRVT